MHKVFSALLVLSIFGCSQTARYYIPEVTLPMGELRLYPGGGCSTPGASIGFPVADGIDGFISAAVGQGDWGLYYGFSITEGATLRVLVPKFEIRSVNWYKPREVPMNQFQLSVYGGLPDRKAGYIKYFAANEELSYTTLNAKIVDLYKDAQYLEQDSFQSSLRMTGSAPVEFELIVPPLIANGERVELPVFRFRYTEQKYTVACIQ